MRWIAIGLVVGSAGCSADRSRASTGTVPLSGPVPTPSEVLAEPVEYRYAEPTAEAGAVFFNEIGVGDPYGAGFPYPVFLGLQALYPEELGADWHGFADAFGLITNRDAPGDRTAVPVGFHVTTDPETRVDFVVANCQLCHAEVLDVGGRELFVPGLGSKRVRLHAYDAALVRIGQDPELTPGRLGKAARDAAKAHGLSWPPDMRAPIVAEAIAKLRNRADVRGRDAERLAKGLPGRVATIEGFMLAMNEQSGTTLELPKELGWAKIPDVAPWRYRESNSFDGVATGDPVALVAEADFAFGVRAQWYVEHPHIATSMYFYLRGFSRDLPFPGSIDAPLAAEGAEAFAQHCASCHGRYDDGHVAYVEDVVPLSVVGTDRVRVDAVTDAFVDAAAEVEETRGLVVTKNRGGYVPRPLVDVWARGTYGHAGQWPDLATLAEPPEQRPRSFAVDPDAPYDLDRIGVAWKPGKATAPGQYTYDAGAPGYGVEGHPFLSDRPEPERKAILEYLKTL